MGGGIVFQAGVRGRSAATALIEQQNVVMLRGEQLAMVRAATGAGSAMQENRRLALGVAAKLPVHLVAVTSIKFAGLIGFNRRIHAVVLENSLYAFENQITNAMAQSQAAGFKFGLGPVIGFGGVICTGVAQQRFAA